MFDPQEFIKLAERILRNSPGASEARTAIGRAYYGAFHAAKRPLEQSFRFSKQENVHQQIRMLFINCSSVDAREIGRNLDDLRDRRNNADYRLDDTVVDQPMTATDCLQLAKRAIMKVQQLLAGPNASSVIAEMKAWAQASRKVDLR